MRDLDPGPRLSCRQFGSLRSDDCANGCLRCAPFLNLGRPFVKPMPALTPVLSAMMCDGMGWFDDVDYKRMVLAFDQIHYLLPKHLAEFRDQAGAPRNLFFPLSLYESRAFTVAHFVPDDRQRDLLFAAASCDTTNQQFVAIVESIPPQDRTYTWSVTNADGDLSADASSPSLPASDVIRAHALLINKFCLAADQAKCVPITGRSYVHRMLAEKLRSGVNGLRDTAPDLLPPNLRKRDVTHSVVVGRLIQAMVSDDELATRSLDDIMAFKTTNRQLFARFSLSVRQLVSKVQSTPLDVTFDREIEDLVATDVWAELHEIEAELRSTWTKVFRSGLKATIRGLFDRKAFKLASAISVGTVPISLQGLTVVSALTAAVPIAGWALSELVDLLESRKAVARRGLYYMVKFAG